MIYFLKLVMFHFHMSFTEGSTLAWPPSDSQRLGAFVCWDSAQGLNFETCCDQEIHGPWGNVECLQGIFSYELCCLPDWRPVAPPSCDWSDFRLRVELETDSAGRNDVLHQDGCCVYYQSPEGMCWNHLPEMAKTLQGTNISAGYATCCFDHFQALVDAKQMGEADPAWLQRELEEPQCPKPRRCRC